MISKETLREPTPEGGDYSEVYYFDDEGYSVDKSSATKILIRELLNDGTLVNEIRMNKPR